LALRAYVDWNIMNGGFYLTPAFLFPALPWGQCPGIELTERYFQVDDKTSFGFAVRNDNAILFPDVGFGYVFGFITAFNATIEFDVYYLNVSKFGFGMITIMPRYDFLIGDLDIYAIVKFNIDASISSFWVQPIIGIAYLF
jgi:hypothetical protein